MKIGIANNLYPPYGRDSGAEIIAKKMLDNFKKQGHEVFIISTRPKNEIRTEKDNIYYLPSSYEKLNKMSTFTKLFWHLRQVIFPPHKKEISKILKTTKPDLFITHNLTGIGLALPKLLLKNKIKHQHVLHDIQLLHPSGLVYLGQEKIINSLLAKIYQQFTKQSLKGVDRIISPSQWLLDLHLQKGFFKKTKTELKRNFNLKKIPSKKISKPIKFFFAGQLEEHKGIRLLIKAWQESKFNKNEATLSLAGGGSLEEYVRKEAKDKSTLNYLGQLNREEMELSLEKHDVVIVSSLVYENSPTIIWEAAKKGLKIIAPNIGGIPELTKFADIVLYKANNINDMREKMRTMLLKNI